MRSLAECRSPLLIGVRHHSATLARVVPKILDAFGPECLLVELPADLADWIEFLGDPRTIAPVAISAADDRRGLFFYPMADFSPEWVAIRWARANGVPVVACDLSVSAKWEEPPFAPGPKEPPKELPSETALDVLLRRSGETDTGGLWQRLVESPGFDADPDSIRAAALLFGWAVRESSPEVSARDRVRESAMREAIRRAPSHSAAVVGSFHAAALLPDVIESERDRDADRLREAQPDVAPDSHSAVGVSLVPYSFEQLDERSGYPAGVRDPVWHQRMVEANSREEADAAAAELITRICRELRTDGHVAGMPDASESLRMMRDLARLRGLPVAGRGELIEAIQSCLVQGDLMGRGRAVSVAAGEVLIGHRLGTVTPAAPRCGLAVEIDRQLQELKLPGRDSFASTPAPPKRPSRYGVARRGFDDQAKEISLDVLRDRRDRARAVVLRRLNAAGIPYATRVDEVERGHRENLIERWRVAWQQGTSATIESVSRYGVTLRQVVEGMVRGSLIRSSSSMPSINGNVSSNLSGGTDADELPATTLRCLHVATQCGLVSLTHQMLSRIGDSFRAAAGLSELVEAITIIARIRIGHMPGLPSDPADAMPPWVESFAWPGDGVTIDALLDTALERLSGMSGSEEPSDVAALVDFLDWMTGDLRDAVLNPEGGSKSDDKRMAITHWCRQTVRHGGNRMRGAAAGALCLLDEQSNEVFATLTRGWLDAAVDREGRDRLRGGLSGATQVLMPRMQSDPAWLRGIQDGIATMNDDVFLARLPPLRGAFADFSPTDRERMLQVCLSELKERGSTLTGAAESFAWANSSDADAITDEWVHLREADLAGRKALMSSYPEAEFWLQPTDESPRQTSGHERSPNAHPQHCDVVGNEARATVAMELPLADRWRLIFGLPPENRTPMAMRCAGSLDQLYGRGRGEGSRGGLAGDKHKLPGAGGGTEAPQPTTAQWAEDLEALFGSDICQEVLGAAAGTGRSGVIEHLDPDSVTPSIELLQQVLSLAGAMPESKVATLRRLAARITQQLAEQLAVRLQPALTGLSSPRPTRRRAKKLNLARTIRENLSNSHRRGDGRVGIVAERLIFNSPAKRQMDWHVTFVVDVSGSMSASVIYSALVAAVLDALPALSVRFLAFSTEVLDFSEQVADPLSLLLEVQVGGGTDIGLGLRAARAGVSVPSRSLVILVSDFEEGVSVGRMVAEVRAMVDSGIRCLGLASLDDSGVARYHQGYASMMAGAGMPVAAVSPEHLARWIGEQVRGLGGGSSSVS
ncbi:DUF5682 family protein [Neorhodopirellula pilleata]|nr:DUF5682 family protein [Neorhodopirellula pilleata]